MNGRNPVATLGDEPNSPDGSGGSGRRWLPTVLPATYVALYLMLAIRGLLWEASGPSEGQRLAERSYVGVGLVAAVVLLGAIAAVRLGPRWRWLAWACNLLLLVVGATQLT